jgi:4-amino-4-deoxy-L-arabinose transferase-like glycosyltransferase
MLPVDTLNSTRLLPDAPAAFFSNASVLLVFVASQRSRWRIKLVAGLAAGLALSLAWLCKEAVALSVPFVVGYLLCSISP